MKYIKKIITIFFLGFASISFAQTLPTNDDDLDISTGLSLYGEGKIDEAIEHLKKVAARNNTTSMVYIAQIYLAKGKTEYNIKEYIQWLKKASDLGDDEAAYTLGFIYYQDDLVPKNIKLAISWWNRATELGEKNSPYNIAIIYINGDGVPQDITIGMKWLERAIALGNGQAAYTMGGIYYNGKDHVKQDVNRAIRFFIKADELGSLDAYKFLEKLLIDKAIMQNENLKKLLNDWYQTTF